MWKRSAPIASQHRSSTLGQQHQMVGNERAAPRAPACPHCYLLCLHNMKQHAKVTVMLLSLISLSKVLLRALKADPHSYFITLNYY